MLDADMLGSKMSTFGPKFGVFDWPVQPVPPLLTVQVNEVVPEAPVVSVAVTGTGGVGGGEGAVCGGGGGGGAGDQAGGADGPPGGPPGRGVGQGLAGRRVGGGDLQAGRGADGRGLAAGAGDGDGVTAAAAGGGVDTELVQAVAVLGAAG